MNFIELHYAGEPRLIAVPRISAIGRNRKETFIWLVGDPDCLYVDESYEDIKTKLQEAGFIWNV